MITKENALLLSMIANEHSFIIGIENPGSCYYYSYHVYLEEKEVDMKSAWKRVSNFMLDRVYRM